MCPGCQALFLSPSQPDSLPFLLVSRTRPLSLPLSPLCKDTWGRHSLASQGWRCEGLGGLEAVKEAGGTTKGSDAASLAGPSLVHFCTFAVQVDEKLLCCARGLFLCSPLGSVESAIITVLVGSIVIVRSWGYTGAPDTQGK